MEHISITQFRAVEKTSLVAKIVTSILDVMVTITVRTRNAGTIVDSKVAVAQKGMVRENRVVGKTGTTEKPVTIERLHVTVTTAA